MVNVNKKYYLHPLKKYNDNQIFKDYLFPKEIVMNQLLSLLGIHYTLFYLHMLLV